MIVLKTQDWDIFTPIGNYLLLLSHWGLILWTLTGTFVAAISHICRTVGLEGRKFVLRAQHLVLWGPGPYTARINIWSAWHSHSQNFILSMAAGFYHMFTNCLKF